jgi:peptide/nickel transport system permease protein
MAVESTKVVTPASATNQFAGKSSNQVQMMRRFSRNVTGMVGLVMVIIMFVAAAGAPLFTKIDPQTINTNAILQSPSAEHIFGTDSLGRDVFSMVLYGSRISIGIGLAVAAFTTISGMFFGLLSGYYPRLDNLIMRSMDIVMAFPTILLALGIVAILGPQLINIVIALVVPYTPTTARLVRGMVLQLKQTDFITAAHALGAGNRRIILRHLVPNSMAIVIVRQTYVLATAILSEAALTFLGVGVPPNIATLGGMISTARSQMRFAPWLPMFPGLAISILVLGFNLLGDGLRDVLDPRMKT